MPNQGTAALRQTYRRASRGFWRWCSSRGASLVLLLLLALALALSYAFPQTPAHSRSDPSTYEEWLSVTRAQYRGWTPFLEAIGAFNILDTIWFRVLLALLAFVSLVSLGEQVSRLLHPIQVRQPAEFYAAPGAVVLSSTLPLARVVACVQRAMAGRSLRVHTDSDAQQTYLYGHTRGSGIGIVLAHAGALLIAAGLAVNGRWGWQQQGVQLLPGQPEVLGPERAHVIELSDTPTSLEEAVIAVDGHGTTIAPGRSVRRGSLVYQLADQAGPLVRVSAARADGTPLALAYYALRPRPSASLHFSFSGRTPADQTDRLFIVPEERLVVRLQWLNPDAGADVGQVPRFQQWVFREGQGIEAPVGEAQILPQNEEATTSIGDITYQWRVSRYVTVDVASQPGWLPLGLGAALLVTSLFWRLVPRQQIWSVVHVHAPQYENGQEGDQAKEQVTVKIRQEQNGVMRHRGRSDDTAWKALRAEIEDVQ